MNRFVAGVTLNNENEDEYEKKPLHSLVLVLVLVLDNSLLRLKPKIVKACIAMQGLTF